jgi:glycosyltransferase involved in cell wall biosynthesis
MPKVLRILNRFNLGGPTYNAGYLTRYMPAEFETMLIGGMNQATEKNSEYILHQLGITPHVLPGMHRDISFFRDRSSYNEILRLIKYFRPDIVHTHASKAGALGRLAAARMGVPVIVHTFHGHVFDSYFNRVTASFYKNIERLLALASSGIIAVSKNQKHDLAYEHKICPFEKIRVIPLGFDLSRFCKDQEENRQLFRKNFQLEDDEIAIGIVGRIVPIKNHLMFLRALKELSGLCKVKVRAFVIGDGESREQIQKAATAIDLDHCWWQQEKRVSLLTFTGWQSRMEQVISGLDIVALTSLNEGTPVNLIEAQAGGKPIVSTRAGGVENVVIPGKTAFLVEKNDHMAMALHLKNLAEDNILRLQMSLHGWDHVKDKFHYTRLVKDMSSFYYELLDKKVVSRKIKKKESVPGMNR